jgi:hypothetical protein
MKAVRKRLFLLIFMRRPIGRLKDVKRPEDLGRFALVGLLTQLKLLPGYHG